MMVLWTQGSRWEVVRQGQGRRKGTISSPVVSESNRKQLTKKKSTDSHDILNHLNMMEKMMLNILI